MLDSSTNKNGRRHWAHCYRLSGTRIYEVAFYWGRWKPTRQSTNCLSSNECYMKYIATNCSRNPRPISSPVRGEVHHLFLPFFSFSFFLLWIGFQRYDREFCAPTINLNEEEEQCTLQGSGWQNVRCICPFTEKYSYCEFLGTRNIKERKRRVHTY